MSAENLLLSYSVFVGPLYYFISLLSLELRLLYILSWYNVRLLSNFSILHDYALFWIFYMIGLLQRIKRKNNNQNISFESLSERFKHESFQAFSRKGLWKYTFLWFFINFSFKFFDGACDWLNLNSNFYPQPFREKATFSSSISY